MSNGVETKRLLIAPTRLQSSHSGEPPETEYVTRYRKREVEEGLLSSSLRGRSRASPRSVP